MAVETENQRVFFALWPDPALRARMDRVAQTLPADGRVVPPEHLHLTLAFPGTVPAAVVTELRERAEAIQAPTMHLRLDRLGYFPRPRVAWLGPSESPLALAYLAAVLRGLCAQSGVTMEERPFQAHVTLRRDVTRFTAVPVEPLDWQVRRMVLVESGRGGHPGPYRVLQSWPLEAPGDLPS